MCASSTNGHPDRGLYHATLVGDAARVTAYERAIRALVRPGDVVLDLGAGTGLLSVLAAKRGARRVIAVESMPVAETARAVARANDVDEVVEVIQGDIQAIDPIAPVDVVVSDFMGRFVIDDAMLDAVAATERWLAPGARFMPQEITLSLAPVGLDALAPVDLWTSPIAGLDLSPARDLIGAAPFGVSLPAECLLAPAETYDTLRPPTALGRWDRALTFTLERPGRLVGLAGFFHATLAPGVTLETTPGHETHWHQTLFPCPPMSAAAGDVLRVELKRMGAGADGTWWWSGSLCRAGVAVATFGSEMPWPVAALRGGSDTVETWISKGQEAFDAGDAVAALAGFEAAVRRLTPADDARAGDVYEDLGICYIHTHRDREAIPALLRALDGDLSSREQSLRLLIDACFRLGHAQDGARYLAIYDAQFGPHPAGWRRPEG